MFPIISEKYTTFSEKKQIKNQGWYDFIVG